MLRVRPDASEKLTERFTRVMGSFGWPGSSVYREKNGVKMGPFLPWPKIYGFAWYYNPYKEASWEDEFPFP